MRKVWDSALSPSQAGGIISMGTPQVPQRPAQPSFPPLELLRTPHIYFKEHWGGGGNNGPTCGSLSQVARACVETAGIELVGAEGRRRWTYSTRK